MNFPPGKAKTAMKIALALLRDETLPVGFRLMLADLAVRGRRYSPRTLAGAVEGWNAAMATGGAPHLQIHRPDLLRHLLTVPLGSTEFMINLAGRHVRDETKVLHPQWRDAIQRGEQIPDDEGEVFATHSITERFIPFPAETPVLGDAVVVDHPGIGHSLQDEIDVIGSGEHAPHVTPAPSPASTHFPSQP